MPSSKEHEVLVRLLRDRPEILGPLLEAAVAHPPEGATLVALPADFSAVVPQYHADLAFGFRREGRLDLVVLVEVQLSRDRQKLLTWPLYEAFAKVRHAPAEAAVLVVTPSEAIARWARRPVIRRPHVSYAPLVLGPTGIPRTTTGPTELVVLSALAHGAEPDGGPLLDAAARALVPLGKTTARLYIDLLQYKLGTIFQRAWEAMVQSTNRPYLSDWFNDLHDAGVAKGRVEGVAAARSALHGVLDARGLTVTRAQRRTIETCADLSKLQAWIVRAATASSAAEVFA
jgi:hypothetical protein